VPKSILTETMRIVSFLLGKVMILWSFCLQGMCGDVHRGDGFEVKIFSLWLLKVQQRFTSSFFKVSASNLTTSNRNQFALTP
jgi:hypothetical protein